MRRRPWPARVAGLIVVAAISGGLPTGAAALPAQTAPAQTARAQSAPAQWRAPRMVDPLVGQMRELDCASPSFCRADDIFGSVFTGHPGHWSAAHWLGGRFGPESMTCPSRSFCAALDGKGDWITNRGSGWSDSERTGVAYTTDISCTSASFCAAVGIGRSDGVASTWDGTSWSHPVSLGQLPIDLSCASPTFCAVTLFLGGAAVFDGSTWGPRAPIDTDDLQYVSCPSAGFCAAASLSEAVVYEHGAWGTPTDLRGSGPELTDVSCMPSQVCLALGVGGAVHTFRDGGWQTSAAIRASGFTDLDCPATDYCVAMKNAGQLFVHDGTSWRPSGSVTDYAHGISSVDCATQTRCMLVDATGAAVRFDGRWSRPRQLDGLQRLVAVTCPTGQLCYAIASSGRLFRYDDASRTWSEQQHSPLTGPVTTLDCPTAAFCMAADRSGHAASFDGAAWRDRGMLAAGGRPLLSCATPEFCGAGVRSTFFRWDGTSWEDLGRQLYSAPTAVSCPDDAFCLVASDSVSTTYRDGRFQGQQVPLEFGVSSASCTSRSFCLATDVEYHVTAFDGQDWSAPTYIGPGRSYPHGWEADVSCASPSVCTVTTAFGWAIRSHG